MKRLLGIGLCLLGVFIGNVPSTEAQVDPALIMSIVNGMPTMNKLLLLADTLNRHPLTYQDFENTLVAALPIIELDQPPNHFMDKVLPWTLHHLPDLLKNDEFLGLMKTFIEELNNHNATVDWELNSGNFTEDRDYYVNNLFSVLDYCSMAKDIMQYKSVRNFFPNNSSDEQFYTETASFFDKLFRGDEWALNMSTTHVPACISPTSLPSTSHHTHGIATCPPCEATTEIPSSTNQPQGILRLEDAIHHGCTTNGWNITINMDLMKQLYPGITTNHIYFGDNSCQGTTTGSYLVFQQGFQDCITSDQISGDLIVYENNLFYAIYDPINPYILRQHKWTYTVECDVNRNGVSSSHVHHHISSHHATATTQYGVDLAFYKDANFINQLSGNPVHINVGDNLYTKVFTTAPDWSMKMRLHTCYTDTGNEDDKESIYYLIKDGCEVDANTHIISQATHETKFVFQDFEYTRNAEGHSVHCNATFCKSADFTVGCIQACNPSAVHAMIGK